MQLQIELLKSYVAVVDSASYTKAGAAVGRSQPAVSMQMKRLEDEVGRPLFLKNGKSFGLTPTGETLLDYARRILALHDKAAADVARPRLAGSVRFGTSEDFASRFLAPILVKFAESFPRIRVDVHCQSSHILKEMIADGWVDLALCTEILDDGRLLYTEPVVWVGSAHHRTHAEKPLRLAVYPEGCAFRQWAIDSLIRTGCSYRIAYVCPSMSGILAAVRAGLAIAPISLSYVPKRFRILAEADGLPGLPNARVALHRAGTSTGEVVDCLARYVRDFFRNEGPRRGAYPDPYQPQ